MLPRSRKSHVWGRSSNCNYKFHEKQKKVLKFLRRQRLAGTEKCSKQQLLTQLLALTFLASIFFGEI